MKLLVYLPVLNEARSIAEVIARLPKALSGVEVVQCLVIDDGSTDGSGALAAQSGALVVSHERNRGVGAALRSAVQFALENEMDVLVGIDADAQFDPNEIPGLVGPIIAGTADLVLGNRFAAGRPEHMSWLKYWGNQRLAGLLSYVSGHRYRDVSCGFRAYGREALLHLNLFGEFTYTHETILSLDHQGMRILQQPITVKYFPGRKSRVAGSLYSYAVQASKIIFRALLDYHPMRVFGTVAATFALIGVGFVFFLLGNYIVTGAFTPYKAFQFIGLGFIIFGALVFLSALIADMINRLRTNQDRLLYELKRAR